MMPDVPSKS
jgi:hypothetical protein